jgi:hypothetical protein
LIPLDEDSRRSFIQPSEYELVLKALENRRGIIKASSGGSVIPATAEDFFWPEDATVPRINHIYLPAEGMPVESVIPVGGQ